MTMKEAIETFLKLSKNRILHGVSLDHLYTEFAASVRGIISREDFSQIFLAWSDEQVWTVDPDETTISEIRHIVELTLLGLSPDTLTVRELADIVLSQFDLAWFFAYYDLLEVIQGIVGDITGEPCVQ